jgi:hypothetical protein
MQHDIQISAYETFWGVGSSKFIVDGVLFRVDYKTVCGLSVAVTRTRSMTNETRNNHGVFYTTTDVKLHALQIRRIERLLYVCAAKNAFCQLIRTLRDGASPSTVDIPRHLTDRAMRMTYAHLDVPTSNALKLQQMTARTIEHYNVKRDAVALFGSDFVDAVVPLGSGISEQRMQDKVAKWAAHLESNPSLIEPLMQMRGQPAGPCVITELQSLVPSIRAKLIASAALLEILGD